MAKNTSGLVSCILGLRRAEMRNKKNSAKEICMKKYHSVKKKMLTLDMIIISVTVYRTGNAEK